jgi:hypothetical protein
MKIVIKGKALKVNDLINYLVENHTKKNKNYQFEIVCEDKFDKLYLLDKEKLLKNKVLVMHNDGFDVFDNQMLEDFTVFKSNIENLTDSILLTESFTVDNFKKEFVHFQLILKENNLEKELLFNYLNLIKDESK